MVQLAEWIDRRLREVWRALGGQPPRGRKRARSKPGLPLRKAPPSRQQVPIHSPPPSTAQLPAEELARLRAENAALRRQLETLMALREPLTPA